eukprot:6595647-Pyramimonas_sp.AAC.1
MSGLGRVDSGSVYLVSAGPGPPRNLPGAPAAAALGSGSEVSMLLRCRFWGTKFCFSTPVMAVLLMSASSVSFTLGAGRFEV